MKDDTIRRQWLMECVKEGWIKFDTQEDENRFVHLIRDIAPSATDTNVATTDTISRAAALNIAHTLIIPGEEFHQNNQAIGNYTAELVKLPSAQPVAKDINVPTKDCISRATAIETVRKAKSIGQAHRMLVQLPSVDAVPVVRCRDCMHYGFTDNRIPEEQVWWCYFWDDVRSPDAYCSDGERNDGDRHEG